VLKGTTVGAGPEQPGVEAHKTFRKVGRFIEPQCHNIEVSYMPGVTKMLQA
jgi:hypothetical protein